MKGGAGSLLEGTTVRSGEGLRTYSHTFVVKCLKPKKQSVLAFFLEILGNQS